jgi:hypothetical protein
LEFSNCKNIFLKYIYIFFKKMKLGPQLMWGLLTNNPHTKSLREKRERERGGWGGGRGGVENLGWEGGGGNNSINFQIWDPKCFRK